MFILGMLGVFEGLFNANYPFKYICSAFPYYDGFYDLSTSINASDAWRTRTLLTTTYPTAYGTLLCGIILVFFPMLKKIDITMPWKLAFVVIYLANLLLSGSRTGMLCSAVGLAFWITRKWHILIKIFMIFALVIAAYFSVQKVIDNFSQETRGSSLQLREQQLLFSIVQIAESPLFGNGVGYLTKQIFETDAYGDRIRNEDILGMESILFPKLINYGFVGLFLYFMLSIWIFVYFFRRRNESMIAISGALEIFAMTLFFILSGNMGNASAYTYLIIGLLAGNIQTSEESEQEEEITQESQMESLAQDVRSK
jgi:O-antigen ligase